MSKYEPAELTDIPVNIRSRIKNEKYELDDVGMSKSSILLFQDKVLKIQESTEETESEVQAMHWLDGKISVPKVIAYECKDSKSYLLMTHMSGRMSCDEYFMNDPEKLTGLLAQAMQELWKVDISACPLNWNLDRKLEAAQYNINNNLVDVDDVEPDTYGPDGFENPEALLKWLKENKPKEELVLSHGDFCLPNIFITDDSKFGFIDLGRTGIADKWQDIALCYRSLMHNYSGKYAGKEYPGYDPDMIFEKLGLKPDWDKIRYYILLDELF